MFGEQIDLSPANFDPSNSQLSFFNANRMDYDVAGLADFHIFADFNFLGDMQLYNPLQMIYARSPDGAWIVISQWPHSPIRFSSSVILHDLNDLRPTELIIPETLMNRLVFSPDNRYIAAAGINQNTGKRKLFLLDTETGDNKLLLEIKDVWSLAWNPDGRQLVCLNWPSFRMDTHSTLRIYVCDMDQ